MWDRCRRADSISLSSRDRVTVLPGRRRSGFVICAVVAEIVRERLRSKR
jgi:hypothetical protein